MRMEVFVLHMVREVLVRFKGKSRDLFLLGKTSRVQPHVDYSTSPWFSCSVGALSFAYFSLNHNFENFFLHMPSFPNYHITVHHSFYYFVIFNILIIIINKITILLFHSFYSVFLWTLVIEVVNQLKVHYH